MNKLRIFQYALLSLILGPLAGVTVFSASKAIAQAVTGSSQISSNGQKITINSPPNDVISGPTNLSGTGNVSVNSQGSGSVGIDIRGSGSGMTFVFEGSVDGTNYVTAPCVVPSTGAIVTGATANGTWTCQAAGYQLMRARLSAISGGTATITLNASAGSNQPPIGTQGTATNITAVAGTATTAAGVPVIGGVNVTLTDCSGTITSGATAQNAFTAAATRHGFTIANIDTSEVLWISFTTTAAASGTGSYPLSPASATSFAGLSSFTSPVGMGINTALSVIAATTSHKFSCTVW